MGRAWVAACCAALALSGCSANYNTAFRIRQIDPSSSAIVVDAKQRALLTSLVPRNANGPPNPQAIRRFCSEPSPDVYSVIAQALGAGGSFGQTADPASIEAAFNLAFSTAEQGSTIPRTQTVNMLREMMFRTCERYLSGGYDEVELSTQAARDQRIMVSILAIEQLTGAVAPRPVVIGATGSSSAGATGEAIVRLDNARKARDDANAALRTAQTAYDSENGTDKVCDAIKGKAEADLTDPQKAKVEPCKQKREALDTAKSKQTEAAATYQELSNLARTGGVMAATSIEADAKGGLDRAGDQSVTAVAATVQAIVAMNMRDSTETLLFCQRYLRQKPEGLDSSHYSEVATTCLEFMKTYIESEGDRLKLLTGEIARAADRQVLLVNTRFDAFWRVNSGIFATAEGRNTFANRVAGLLGVADRGKDQCFRTATSQDAVKACFEKLPNRVAAILTPGD